MTDHSQETSPFAIPVSRDDLVATFRSVRWGRTEALEEARSRAIRQLDDKWAVCTTLAEKLSHPLERIVRNVVAEAPAHTVPYWKLVLLAQLRLPGNSTLKPLLDALPPTPPDWKLVETILRSAEVPPEEQYRAFFSSDDPALPVSLLDAAFRKARPGLPSPAAILRVLLDDRPRGADRRPGLLRERFRLIDRTFASLPSTVRVRSSDLRSLPAAARQALASRQGLLSRIGGPRLSRDVRRDPRLRRDAALGLQRRGLEALRKRRFLDEGLLSLADHLRPSIPLDSKLLENALRLGTKRTEPAAEVADRLARLIRFSPPLLRPALTLLLTPKVGQGAVIAKMSPEGLAAMLAILPSRDHTCHESAVTFFTKGLEPEEPWQRERAASESMEDLLRIPRLAVAGGFRKALRSTPLPTVAAEILSDPECLNAIATNAGPEGRHLLAAFVERVRRQPALASKHLRPLLAAVPSWGLRAVTDALPGEVLVSVIKDQGIELSVREAAVQRACRGKRGETLLGVLLTAEKHPGKDLSSLLLQEANRSRLRLSRLFPGHHDFLAEPAAQRLPIRRVLPAALNSVRVGRELERKYSRSQLRDQIPWSRRHFQSIPHAAAAFELALAIGLTRAGQLRKMGQRSAAAAGGERGTALDSLYRCYDLPKKNGGNRTVTVPADSLKSLQRRLLRFGFAEVPLHPAATGFRPGFSIRDNALPHVGKPLVVNVDIASFFPSTRYELVHRASRRLLGGRISPAAARLAADICSFGGALPTGAPTSPAIANIVLTPIDKALAKVCARTGIDYTRYADDLSFSGGSNAKRVLPFVHRLLGTLGYRLDEKKTNLFRRGRRQVVTGLVVNEKPNLPRRIRRKLRAAVDQRVRSGHAKWHGGVISDAKLLGLIAHLNLVQPEEARRHRLRLEPVLKKKPA